MGERERIRAVTILHSATARYHTAEQAKMRRPIDARIHNRH
jgi:hypothetical protein